MAKQTLLSKIKLLRPKTPICNMRVHIWSASTFVGNARIILTRSVPQSPSVYLLRLRSSTTKSIFTGSSIRLKLNIIVLSFLFKTSLRLFSNKVLENQPYLWPVCELGLNKIPNTNRKKKKIGLLIFSTLSLSW